MAVIDSGVHAAHPHVQGVAGGIGVDGAGTLHEDYLDRLGHGTAVTAVIREKAPEAAIWAVKIFDRELRCTLAALLAALHWSRTHGVHIVNLSLGTTTAEHEEALSREISAAAEAGMLIVCAAPTEGQRWLPGALPGVVPVLADLTLERHSAIVERDADGRRVVRAAGYPRPIPGVPVERNLSGVSFAVANVSGLQARCWPAPLAGWEQATGSPHPSARLPSRSLR